jgi:hypothetical protein
MMMLHLAEGLGLPLGLDGFADYGQAVEAARFFTAWDSAEKEKDQWTDKERARQPSSAYRVSVRS